MKSICEICVNKEICIVREDCIYYMNEKQTNGLTTQQELERNQRWLKDLNIRYNELDKHKNDLGDLLAKREEQLDKIKELVSQVDIKGLEREHFYHLYNIFNQFNNILEEE